MKEVDFVIIGSSGGGGTISWLLAKAGFEVVVLEQGSDWFKPIQDDGRPEPQNPALRRFNPDPHDESEGCLSVPGESFPLKRGDRASVSGFDAQGNELAFEATGWFARCMQHEYDHLNGFLYVDRLNESWSRKARKAAKRAGWGKPGASWMPGVDPDPFGHDSPDEHDL